MVDTVDKTARLGRVGGGLRRENEEEVVVVKLWVGVEPVLVVCVDFCANAFMVLGPRIPQISRSRIIPPEERGLRLGKMAVKGGGGGDGEDVFEGVG